MVSIIVPIRFRLDLTETCIDSILGYTKDFELILVQEGKDKGITERLKDYEANYFADDYKVRFVQNKKPKGFAGAMNTGLELATGDYYCFLNNDTVVVRGWLEEMLKAFENEKVGLVSPTFGNVRSIQSVNFNKGQQFDLIVDDPLLLIGVCFLIKKEVMDKIGKWDDTLGLGGGEDNDMCIRVINAGYKLAIARRSYIYHYGSASFRELFNNDKTRTDKFARSQFKKFEKKYPDLKIKKEELNINQ